MLTPATSVSLPSSSPPRLGVFFNSAQVKTLAVSILCLASVVLADDFKTTDGQEYKNVKVKRVEPDGIVLSSKYGISKVYFTELPKEVQERFHYDSAKAAAYSAQQNQNLEALRKQQAQAQAQPQEARATPAATPPMAVSGIETLPPITVALKDELLSALKMTDELDAMFKRGCSSSEFIAAAVPIEKVVIELGDKLPKADPRHDLLANSLEAYQQVALAMRANENGKGERPYATIGAAGVRKQLLRRILEGNLTPEEKSVYYAWRKGLGENP